MKDWVFLIAVPTQKSPNSPASTPKPTALLWSEGVRPKGFMKYSICKVKRVIVPKMKAKLTVSSTKSGLEATIFQAFV